jgi:hypothetical protein
MSVYSEQTQYIIQTKLIPLMQSLVLNVSLCEPYSYTSTSLEEQKRQLDYYSMVYDFLYEYTTGAEELTNAKLINVIRLLDPPTMERKAGNFLQIKTTDPDAVPGYEVLINDLAINSQTILDPGSTITITIIYTPDRLINGRKTLDLVSPVMSCDGFTLVIPNYYIPYELAGTNLVLDVTSYEDNTELLNQVFTIPIAYMTDRLFYYGVGAPGLNAVQIQALSSLTSIREDTTLVFSPDSELYYFAYPAVYGALTYILDHNGFDMISDFTRSTVAFTLSAPNFPTGVQDYYVYSYDLPTIQTNFNITFKF